LTSLNITYNYPNARAVNATRELDIVVWAVNPRNDTLAKLAAYVSQFFLESFRPTGIRPRLKVADEISDHPISAEARHHLFLIAKEAIHNVIKHSHAHESSFGNGLSAERLRIQAGR
jgi:signal transduction histidine kinase